MAKKAWDSSNPLYRWLKKKGRLKSNRKANKRKRSNRSVVRPMARRRNYARRIRRRSRGLLNTASIMKYVRIGALVAPAVSSAFISGTPYDKIENAIYKYTGYSMKAGSWHWDGLVQGWTPFIVTSLVTVGVQKLLGMIRRL